MSTTAPLEAALQPHPFKSDGEQGSQYATARPQGDPEHDPMVFHESRIGDETKTSTQKSVSPDPEHNQQSDQSFGHGALGRPSSNEAGAQCHEMGPIMWTREIETLKDKLLELEEKIHEAPNKLSGQTSHALEESPITPTVEEPNSQSDEYRGALENLYSHRRYWETTQGPGRWSSRLYRGDRRHVLQGYQGYEGPIVPEYDRAAYSSNIISSKNKFTRPRLSDMLNDDVYEFAQRPDGAEQEFDRTIAYGKRRERLRQNFEWELDRLFMEEEFQQMRIDEARKIRTATEREEAGEEGEPESGSESQVPEGPKTAEPESPVELRYVDWYAYADWFRTRNVSAIATVEVLLGEPVDFESGPEDDAFFRFRPLLRRRPEGFKQPSRTMNGRGQLPERVRIHSSALMEVLAKILSKNPQTLSMHRNVPVRRQDNLLPLVDVRPFKALVYCYETLQKMTSRLEKYLTPRVDSEQENDSVTAQSGLLSEARTLKPIDDQQDDGSGGSETSSEYTQDEGREDYEKNDVDNYRDVSGITKPTAIRQDIDGITTPTALRHLRCLLKFLDEDVLSRREYLNDRKCSKVWFSDMDFLFTPGTHVIENNGKQVYRVIDVQSPEHQKSPRTWAKAAPCSITCIYIDFDGKIIGPVVQNFEISKFDGEKDVTALAVYPVRFCTSWKRTDFSEAQWEKVEGLSDHLKLRHSLVARGQKFLEAAAVKQMYYTGPTLDTREDVESQVVIDFDAALSGDNTSQKKFQPRVQPLPMIFERLNKNSTYKQHDSDSESSSERGGGVSADMACQGNCCFGQSILHEDDNLSRLRRAAFLKSLLPQSQSFNTQASIAVIPRALGDLHMTGQPAVSDDDLLIMSFRVFGFILHNRKWGKLHQHLLYFCVYSILMMENSWLT